MVRRFHLKALTVVIVLAATASACGGESAGSGDDRADIRAAITELRLAFAERDADAACDALTTAAQDHVSGLGHGRSPCPRNVAEMVFPAAAWEHDSQPPRRLVRIALAGDTATALVDFGDGVVGKVPLAKDDGRWKVDALFGDTPAGKQQDNYD